MEWKLIALSSQHRGISFNLIEGFDGSLGRIEKNKLIINDPSISSVHCKFIARHGKLSIFDNHSTNGISVNGVPALDAVLKHGDILMFGSLEMLVQCDTSCPMESKRVINMDATQTVTMEQMKNFSPFYKNDLKKEKSGRSLKWFIAVSILTVFVLIGILIATVKPEQIEKSVPSLKINR